MNGLNPAPLTDHATHRVTISDAKLSGMMINGAVVMDVRGHWDSK